MPLRYDSILDRKKAWNFQTLITHRRFTYKPEDTSYNIVVLNEDPDINPVRKSLWTNVTQTNNDLQTKLIKPMFKGPILLHKIVTQNNTWLTSENCCNINKVLTNDKIIVRRFYVKMEPCLSTIHMETNTVTWLQVFITYTPYNLMLTGTYYAWLNHAHIFFLFHLYSQVDASLKITVYIIHKSVQFSISISFVKIPWI